MSLDYRLSPDSLQTPRNLLIWQVTPLTLTLAWPTGGGHANMGGHRAARATGYAEALRKRGRDQVLIQGGFKFQVQRVNDGAVAHRLPGA